MFPPFLQIPDAGTNHTANQNNGLAEQTCELQNELNLLKRMQKLEILKNIDIE